MITRAGALLMPWKFLFFFCILPLITDVVVGAALTAALGSSGEEKKDNEKKDNEKKKNLISAPGGFRNNELTRPAHSALCSQSTSESGSGARGLQLRLISRGVGSPKLQNDHYQLLHVLLTLPFSSPNSVASF